MNKTASKERETMKKIDSKEALEFALTGMSDIRDENTPNSVKAQKERRLGKSCLIKLAGRSSRNEENKASLSYFNREVTKLRTAIRAKGFIRHDFNDKIKALSEKFPIASTEFLSLVDIHHEDAKNKVSEITTKLHTRFTRTKDSDKKSQLKKALSELKKTKFEPVIFETLIRTAEQKDEMAKAAEERVEAYHAAQRPIDYKKTYQLMGKLLTAQHDWTAMAFGLVLACGRRSTEIICNMDGQFKPTKNSHEAEFTTVVKTKEEKTYNIPLLVDFQTFNETLERLRNHPRISPLITRVETLDSADERHTAINSSLQHQLNKYVKETMGGNEWKLKDGRAMYARITYAEYCATAKKAGRIPSADDLFFKKKLGHSDPATQQNYKQFTVENMETINHREVKQAKAEAVAVETGNRLADLKKLFESDEIKDSRAFTKYAEWVIQQVETDTTVKITSSWIKAELGGNKGIIAKFVRIVKEAGLQAAF